MAYLITCETGGSMIPEGVSIDDSDAVVGDVYARYATRFLAATLDVQPIENPYSPAVIDVSMSLRNRHLLGPSTRRLPREDRDRLIDTIHRPYRALVRAQTAQRIQRHAQCIHVSVSTFELRVGNTLRRTDVGLGYDPSCIDEYHLAADWYDDLYDRVPMIRVRRNYPKRGVNDGITRWLRTQFGDQGYLGIELQLNRAWVGRDVAIRDQVLCGIAQSLRVVCEAPISAVA